MTFEARFIGRKRGSIEVTQRFVVEVSAPTKWAARLALYKSYEHIMFLNLLEII